METFHIHFRTYTWPTAVRRKTVVEVSSQEGRPKVMLKKIIDSVRILIKYSTNQKCFLVKPFSHGIPVVVNRMSRSNKIAFPWVYNE